MSEFDPYAAWLDIPPHHQPPQPWRLLAVAPDCRDPEQLRAAVQRAEQRIRQSASPEHSAWVERMCVEIRAAERTILAGAVSPPGSEEQALAPPAPAANRGQRVPPMLNSPPPPAGNQSAPPSQSSPGTPASEFPLPAPGAPGGNHRSSQAGQGAMPIQSPPPAGTPAQPPANAPSEQPVAASRPAVGGPIPGGPLPGNAEPIIAQPVMSQDPPPAPLQSPVHGANLETPATGPLPVAAPPTHGVGGAHAELSSPQQPLPPADEMGYDEELEQSEGPGALVIAAVAISCFLFGVVLMLIFILMR